MHRSLMMHTTPEFCWLNCTGTQVVLPAVSYLLSTFHRLTLNFKGLRTHRLGQRCFCSQILFVDGFCLFRLTLSFKKKQKKTSIFCKIYLLWWWLWLLLFTGIIRGRTLFIPSDLPVPSFLLLLKKKKKKKKKKKFIHVYTYIVTTTTTIYE